jgi:hypothetical protein
MPMICLVLLTLNWVQFTSVDGHEIDVNPDQVVKVRDPPAGYLDKHVKCLIDTADGKYTAVVEDCPTVRNKLGIKKP